MAELSIGRKKAVERKSQLERPSLAQVWELSYLIRPIPQIPTGLSRELKRFLDLPHQLDCWSSINTMEPGSSGLPLSGAEYNQFRHTVQQNAAIALRLRVDLHSPRKIVPRGRPLEVLQSAEDRRSNLISRAVPKGVGYGTSREARLN
jgi:hypothetical protein